MVLDSVVYPDSLNPDPDPVFQLNPEVLRTKYWKNTAENCFYSFFYQKYNLLNPKLPLKVPSHQIRLGLKCYGWIGLGE